MGLKRIVVKRSIGFSTFLRGCNPAWQIEAIKSVHFRVAKIKQISQSRKYIYF